MFAARNRLLTFVGVSLALLVLGGCCNPCSSEPSAAEKAKDDLARKQYYEEAAKTYYEGGKYEQAVVMWDKVLANRPDDQWAKFGLAKSLQMVGTVPALRRSEAVLKEIIDLPWEHPTRGNIKFEVQTTLANVYSELADFYTRDMLVLEQRAKDDPGCNPAELQRQIDKQKCMRDSLLQQSIPLWQAVLCQSPENQYALAGLAKANLLAGSEQAGIHYAERYIALSRTSQENWKQLLCQWEQQMQGQVTREQRNHYLSKIHGAREKELSMLVLVGSVHMRREEFHSAIQNYDQVLEKDPARVAALVERAQARAGLGQYELAVKDLEEYLKLTDARRQREARINAAELLDRYRQIAARTTTTRVPTRAAVPSTTRYVPPQPARPAQPRSTYVQPPQR